LAVEAELGARDLHASLGTLLELGDHVEVWPAHVGGSLSAARLSLKTSSTIGYESRIQPAAIAAAPGVVQRLTTSIPTGPPERWPVAWSRANRRTREHLPPSPPLLDAEALHERSGDGE